MFSEWDEHAIGCRCPECLERQRVYDERIKDMTWEDYGKSIKIPNLGGGVPNEE